MPRPHFGRCRRTVEHHRTYGFYRDDLVTGVCLFGFYVEVAR